MTKTKVTGQRRHQHRRYQIEGSGRPAPKQTYRRSKATLSTAKRRRSNDSTPSPLSSSRSFSGSVSSASSRYSRSSTSSEDSLRGGKVHSVSSLSEHENDDDWSENDTDHVNGFGVKIKPTRKAATPKPSPKKKKKAVSTTAAAMSARKKTGSNVACAVVMSDGGSVGRSSLTPPAGSFATDFCPTMAWGQIQPASVELAMETLTKVQLAMMEQLPKSKRLYIQKHINAAAKPLRHRLGSLLVPPPVVRGALDYSQLVARNQQKIAQIAECERQILDLKNSLAAKKGKQKRS